MASLRRCGEERGVCSVDPRRLGPRRDLVRISRLILIVMIIGDACRTAGGTRNTVSISYAQVQHVHAVKYQKQEYFQFVKNTQC